MFLEGLPYFVSPRGVRRYLEQVTRAGDRALRVMGLSLMLLGLVVMYFALY